MKGNDQQLARRGGQPLARRDAAAIEPSAAPIVRAQAQPQPVHVQQLDTRPTHYRTMKEQGYPDQVFNVPKLPSMLQIVVSLVIAILFVVGASMFSISLTAYSDSVDRRDESRRYLRVD